MCIRQIIGSAVKNRHTVILTAQEEDGSVQTREAEPYSYRYSGGHEHLLCFDLTKLGPRSIVVSRIIAVEETANPFLPLWLL